MKQLEKLKTVGVLTSSILMIVVMSIVLALPTMWLWNWALVPSVEGINEIGLGFAWGINTLFSILFKSHNSK